MKCPNCGSVMRKAKGQPAACLRHGILLSAKRALREIVSVASLTAPAVWSGSNPRANDLTQEPHL